jgi:hypothetical protein
VELLVSVPRIVLVCQQFNLKLPWYLQAVWSMPVWAVVAAALIACLSGLRPGGRLRLVVLVGMPLAVAVAIHLSVYETQGALVWAFHRSFH